MVDRRQRIPMDILNTVESVTRRRRTHHPAQAGGAFVVGLLLAAGLLAPARGRSPLWYA